MGKIEIERHKSLGICTVKTPKGKFAVVYQGPIKLLKRARKVAIVGSRKASEWALKSAHLLAQELGRQGVLIISGYANGVDTKAHQGALEAKRGATVVVSPEGILRFKPNKLGDIPDWEKRTLILSQFAPDAPWNPRNAMMRNEIICKLADAVIVVEAGPEKDESGKMSGSFQAGKTALRLRVPLFVLVPETEQPPLDIDAPLWKCPPGNEQLLKMGAEGLRIDTNNFAESIRDAVKKVLQSIQLGKKTPKIQKGSGRKAEHALEHTKLT